MEGDSVMERGWRLRVWFEEGRGRNEELEEVLQGDYLTGFLCRFVN